MSGEQVIMKPRQVQHRETGRNGTFERFVEQGALLTLCVLGSPAPRDHRRGLHLDADHGVGSTGSIQPS